MSDQQQARSGVAAATPPPAALPDINAETYPFDTVMHLLDEAAYFTLFSIPSESGSRAILSSGSFSRVIGMRIKERLHRFSMVVQPPTREKVSVHNTVGEKLGQFEHRW